MEILTTAQEIAAQNAQLARFHKRRLRRGASTAALDERVCFTQNYPTHIARCKACGLVLRDPRPSDFAIAQMYARDTYSRKRLDEMFPAQCALYSSKARTLAKWLKPGQNVVEVGSFVGGFLCAGRDQGWKMLGIDPGEEVAQFCREKGLAVFQGTLEGVDLPPASLDCLAIWNTFDQLPDPKATLSAAGRLLKPHGTLALRVPNGEFFAAANALRGMCRGILAPAGGFILNAMIWNNMLAFPYLYGYSAGTLDRLLSGCGFARRMIAVDTLVPLADEETKPWAAWEERAVKTVVRALARAEAILPNSRPSFAPWLDLYYTKHTACHPG